MRKGILVVCVLTSWIFSLDPNKSSDREPVQCVVSSLLVGKKTFRLGWDPDTELVYLHLGQSSGQKVSHLVDKYHKSEDRKGKKDTKKERHRVK